MLLKTDFLSKLTDKKILFCEEYLTNGRNSILAAKAAGIANGTALLRNEYIQAYIKHRMEALEEVSNITLNYKIEKLKKVIEVGIPSDSQDIVNPEMARLALTAISEHNKMAGDYAPTKQANFNCNVNLDSSILEAKKAIKEF